MADNHDTHPAEDVIGDLMADLAELEEEPRYRPGPPCRMGVILAQLVDQSAEAATLVAGMVDNVTISASPIAEKLGKFGYPVPSQTILRHRRRGQHNGCRCPK